MEWFASELTSKNTTLNKYISLCSVFFFFPSSSFANIENLLIQASTHPSSPSPSFLVWGANPIQWHLFLLIVIHTALRMRVVFAEILQSNRHDSDVIELFPSLDQLIQPSVRNSKYWLVLQTKTYFVSQYSAELCLGRVNFSSRKCK